MLFSLGAAREGEQWLDQTRQVNPDSRYLLMAGYERYLAQKQFGALTELMRDAWMRETTEGTYLSLGSALTLDGKPAESYAMLKESLAKYPFNPETGDVSFSTESALWLALAARAVGDDALWPAICSARLVSKSAMLSSNAIISWILSSRVPPIMRWPVKESGLCTRCNRRQTMASRFLTI